MLDAYVEGSASESLESQLKCTIPPTSSAVVSRREATIWASGGSDCSPVNGTISVIFKIQADNSFLDPSSGWAKHPTSSKRWVLYGSTSILQRGILRNAFSAPRVSSSGETVVLHLEAACDPMPQGFESRDLWEKPGSDLELILRVCQDDIESMPGF